MSTSTIEKPKESTENNIDSDKEKFFHYVQKDKIVESAVMGNLVKALCGQTFPVTKAAKPDSPICAKCQEIYNSLKK